MGDFERPGFLFLLLAIPLLAILARGSRANLSRPRHFLALGLRATLLLLIVLALAGPRWRLPVAEPNVIFLMDESQSVDEAARARSQTFLAEALKTRPTGQRSAIVRFAKNIRVESGFSGEAFSPAEQPRDETRLAAAVNAASGLFPPGPTRIVVCSDGGETQPHPPAVNLRPNGEVDVVALPSDSRPDVWMERLSAPAQVRESESFNLTVTVGATGEARPGEVTLYQEGLLVERRSLLLEAGHQTIVFKNLRPTVSRSRFEAVVTANGNAHPENDRLIGSVTAKGKPRVLLIDPQPTLLDPLANALREEKLNVEIRPPAALPSRLEELRGFDLVLLSDTPISALPAATVHVLATWVKSQGGGLIVTGGENSFGAGGYFRSPLESLLPIRSEHPDKVESPVCALEVVLDRSGSMTAVVDGQTKMDLANQGAVMALNQLQDGDYFGLLAVAIEPKTVLPPARPGDREAAIRLIRGVEPSGGGIYVYTALVEAYRQLRPVPAKVKHVILFADASDAEESAGRTGQTAEALSLAALATGTTTSVVALGKESDKDTAFLRSLAQVGGGRFYLTDDATTLPQLFALETIRATQSSLIEEPFFANPGTSPVIAGLDWKAAPPLLGYNATKLQPGAEALLTTPSGDPLLAIWPVGLGNVAAFTSDAKSRWAGEWLNWSGFGKFWGQVLRAGLRESSPEDFELDLSETEEAIKIHLRSDRDGQKFVVHASASSGEDLAPEVRQIAPGEYEASLPKGTAEDFHLSVVEVDGRSSPQFRFWARDRSAEFNHSLEGEAHLRRLVEVGKGRMNPKPADVWRPVAEPDFRSVSLVSYALIGAILVFLLDLWNRRRSLK